MNLVTTPSIVVKNVSKLFPQNPQEMRLRGNSFSSHISQLISVRKKKPQPFEALKDVSFTVFSGESVGIIGYNGAGKSTLLRVITGITEPTKGNVIINGKFGELFALNSGFKVELSGRKNIFLIAAIKGIKKHDIEELQDEIIKFAGIQDFIDQPVKVYSTGMRSRLGFSILIHTLPDIVIIDEALSAGDIQFNKKCKIELENMVAQNKTLLIVSHSVSSIRNLCARVIWLHKGEILMDGEPNEVLREYQNSKIPK